MITRCWKRLAPLQAAPLLNSSVHHHLQRSTVAGYPGCPGEEGQDIYVYRTTTKEPLRAPCRILHRSIRCPRKYSKSTQTKARVPGLYARTDGGKAAISMYR